MRRFLFVGVLLLTALVTGCEVYDVEVDYDYRRDIGILVKNSAGEDLLDPNVEGNILGNDISVEYDGETYPLVENEEDGYCLTIGPYGYENRTRVLKFGHFYEQNADRQFTINWGDGTSSEVIFLYSVTYETVVRKLSGRRSRYNEAIWHYKIWVNGVLASDDSLIAEILK